MYSKNKRARRPQDKFTFNATTRPGPGLYLPLSEFLNFQAITLEKEYILKIQNCKLEKTKTDKHLHCLVVLLYLKKR